MTIGVLPDTMLQEMITRGEIAADPAIIPEQIQPASLDLRLGTVAYRLRASFLAGKGQKVSHRLHDFEMHRMALTDDGVVLEKGCVYLVPLMESLALPEGVTAVANAKSSTGRLDLLTRLITDDGTEFDRIPQGYSGPLYAEICPRSFSVLVRPGMRLNQIRFRAGQAVLSDAELKILHQQEPLVDGPAVIDEGLGFSVDLKPSEGDLVGYRAKPHTGVIDIDKIGHYPARDFWEEVRASDGRIILDPGAFYILVSREAVTIPPDHAAEMAPYLAMVGEFRVHYAGFFDPGFGHGAAGGTGSRGVLEVRCHEAPFALEHGQVVGRLVYERMAEEPRQLYGKDIASNYQGQGLKLAKHFRMG
ncbi:MULTISPECIES: 2'-deoxycytidine 5'-triphosphate deaminase [Thioclava]|uniref:2'-deoxycytidine 5'-triphosphate deaminase n=1 Tax=Thioclava nitratireducens TaxID=1915078 RepID=A0ABM6IIK6_9RHOB|nr:MULTISPECIES: 2'-deoxycytidine 5'-triphosphate deaminase [Thioclava]AQS48671.1 2'-deoxycytidine 5'-triphosphate deaminase [Thioclava nitratireducens]OWY01572.1 2'-deoxycytidine 5'-triphosphate deaminase [Thioclava sp. IC9]OWY01967.1 2'-deoxycytidine 5'-triphosphate deaminase [Thioclava sp. F1Mire-8]OWY07468.1 2'-deoxycytidine 5'-triphosphate deaminase [Thioclava sp. F42-5]OWY17560.1 2'-deoxycytidine 5'-triphosphate deaminase [Thioclava sp. JM3]